MKSPRIVVLGIGNALLTDEGVGVHALARVRVEDERNELTVVDGGTLGPALLEFVTSADCLIVIDAARLDRAPGTVDCFREEAMDCLLRSRLRTVHELGLKDLLDMARAIGALPSRRALIAVEPAVIDWGTELSPAVQTTLPIIADLVRGTASGWRASETP